MIRKLFTTTLAILSISTISGQETRKENVQFGIVTPLGTNGKLSPITTNKISINLLSGYSYGNTIFELGGISNINTNETRGVQVAGLFNYSGNADYAVQFAGITNISKSVVAVQFGGILNVTHRLRGAQFGGILNIADDVKGVQFGGILNIAKSLDGAQFGGIINIAKDVTGVQVGGILNVATNLNGVQIGFINYAKRSKGVSIGFINIVEQGGKQEFEISHSETLDAAISFKLGTDKFYTIFAGGVKDVDIRSKAGYNRAEYAVGVGIGTYIDWKRGWGNEFELITYDVTEDGDFFNNNDNQYITNSLNQFKFTVSKQFGRRFAIFGGPVLNVAVANFVDPVTGEIGGSFSSVSKWEKIHKSHLISGWIGFSAGIRF